MPAIRTRKDAWKLKGWDPTLLWYAKAVAKMLTRSMDDPTSWRYQAAIHDYVRDSDPLSDPADKLPSGPDQKRFWRQCQHFSWFFLPWHRMFLLYFEQIVAATVAELGGPADWSLPYWNYSDASNPDARRLPAAFREPSMPDGTPNPLRVAQRQRGNSGNSVADAIQTDIRKCLREPSFEADQHGGSPGFGGPQTKFNHDQGQVGMLEATPHGSMHVRVGGWMGQFNTAGLDPIFWLHHSNIDRLWSVWRGRNPQHVDPTEALWLRGVAFEFHDAQGKIVSLTCDKMVDTKAAPLFYKYEDESDPLAGQAFALVARRPEMAERRVPEMIGATDKPVTLTGRTAVASFAANPPTGPFRGASALDAVPPRTFLHFENITGSGQTGGYSVYLNIPSGSTPANHPELLAGHLPLFGVAEASRAHQNHPGSGLHYALEIGDIIRTLAAKGDWNPKDIRVAFVPDDEEGGEGVERALVTAPKPVQIGRISLYHS